MQSFTYLIVGGGVAGTTAAETIRKHDEAGSIAIVTDEPHPLYSRVLLSKPAFLTGSQPFDSVWMKKAEWYDSAHIALLTGKQASKLDGENKVVTLNDGEEIHYEKLLIATGTHTRHLDVPGVTKKGVHYLRTLEHARGIIQDLKDGRNHAVMIGSACVTYEVADILRSMNIEVTEVMREQYFWEPSLSQPEAQIVEGRLVERGVTIIREAEIAEITGDDGVSGVTLKDGRQIPCDMVFAFIGIIQPTEWLETSGIALNRGILANEYLETSLPHVWAAGDGARFKDTILNETVMMGNWMNAVKQGETAALNMLGEKKEFSMVSFHSSHGFGDMISFAGDVTQKEGRVYIMRGIPGERSLVRLILRGNNIVGATMINKTPELNTIVKLIQGKTDVSSKHAELADPTFDLKTLLS